MTTELIDAIVMCLKCDYSLSFKGIRVDDNSRRFPSKGFGIKTDTPQEKANRNLLDSIYESLVLRCDSGRAYATADCVSRQLELQKPFVEELSKRGIRITIKEKASKYGECIILRAHIVQPSEVK
jgi:hypothetical protein